MTAKNEASPEPIEERTIAYALRIIRLVRSLPNDAVGRTLGTQLLRSGTSVGANVHEAHGAQTRADFVAKMSVAQKEAHESLYWLRLMEEAQLLPGERLRDIVSETTQLVRILASIVVSSKRNAGVKT